MASENGPLAQTVSADVVNAITDAHITELLKRSTMTKLKLTNTMAISNSVVVVAVGFGVQITLVSCLGSGQ